MAALTTDGIRLSAVREGLMGRPGSGRQGGTGRGWLSPRTGYSSCSNGNDSTEVYAPLCAGGKLGLRDCGSAGASWSGIWCSVVVLVLAEALVVVAGPGCASGAAA